MIDHNRTSCGRVDIELASNHVGTLDHLVVPLLSRVIAAEPPSRLTACVRHKSTQLVVLLVIDAISNTPIIREKKEGK